MIAQKHDQLPLNFGTLKAGEITSAIIAYLTKHGFKVWRQNTSGIYDPQTGCWRKNPQGCNGVPDIIGFRKRDGLFIGIEVKTGRDRLRPEQKQFLEAKSRRRPSLRRPQLRAVSAVI